VAIGSLGAGYYRLPYWPQVIRDMPRQNRNFWGDHFLFVIDRLIKIMAYDRNDLSRCSGFTSYKKDADNEYLDGSKHCYILKFDRNYLPPSNVFWSVTMYKLPEHLLVITR
jgi:hypothetical protein